MFNITATLKKLYIVVLSPASVFFHLQLINTNNVTELRCHKAFHPEPFFS